MNPSFQLVATPFETFAPLFALSAEELREKGMSRVVADSFPGFPCRVSLVDAQPGETLLALHYVHLDVLTPYRASGPIFVREGAQTAQPEPGEIPLMFRHRILSLRGYDDEGMLNDATVVHGEDLEEAIELLFQDPLNQYLHIHNAGPGCFDCSVIRV